ncbi:ribonuclease D [Friedmanniella endophytica]|uniref:Ribonuclease D n=1 Tax=Microlunatus kandeliicorticis TaxID=1759536 RepID=A0A7W3ITE0_9ACTN|nr:ribonuclease D [Microlunatus kandeliicorticis]MBA8794884.1 ribonuclease D [Microlunatus kandeliicorticis]
MTVPPASFPAASSPGSPEESAGELPGASPDPPLLTAPAEGVPEVVRTVDALAEATARLAGGHGPVAVDAERAHGFRYSQRAYLIQFRRAGSGTVLIDPVMLAADQHRAPGSPAVPTVAGPETPADLSGLGSALADSEWVIHAATQDLACLVEVGLVPPRLFDTELAGRLLGYPRVNLGTLVEQLFGVRLLKEHSASDWSVRPLPDAWLVYATLDVELLVELRDALAAQLVAAGKDDWARQEFDHLVAGATAPREPRADPWRRTSGIHKIRTARGLAIVAELWRARDAIAQRTDRAPARILPDSAIVELALHRHPSRKVLQSLPGFTKRPVRRWENNWLHALDTALALTPDQLPPLHRNTDAPPQARIWASRDPVAAARLQRVRSVLITEAERLGLPIENLVTPEYVRRLAWTPPEPATEAAVDAFLAEQGARPWQRAIVVPLITPRLPDPRP